MQQFCDILKRDCCYFHSKRLYVLRTAPSSKEMEVTEGMGVFQEKWASKYLFVEFEQKVQRDGRIDERS